MCIATRAASAAMSKDSLWHRIRKSLQTRRRTVSVNGLSAVVTAAMQAERRKADGASAAAGCQPGDASSMLLQSHDVTSGRLSARAAREMWRKSVERGRAAASGGGSGSRGCSRDASWSPSAGRSEQRSADNEYWWTCGDLNLSSEQYGGVPEIDIGHDVISRRLSHHQLRRLQPSLSLPERFASTAANTAVATGSSFPWQHDVGINGGGYQENSGHVIQAANRRHQSLSVHVTILRFLLPSFLVN